MSSNWKALLLKSDKSIKDALEIINNEVLKIALIIDKSDLLVGVVTDGDIRRALLKNFTLNDEVRAIANKTPEVIDATETKDHTYSFEKKGINVIPIIENGKVIGVKSLTNVMPTELHENPVFIMAGGFGKRLRPLTESCPKPMLPLANKPMLEIIIERFKKTGFRNFYISIHYLPEIITNYFGDGSKLGVNINYVHEVSPLGTGGALGLLPEDISDLPLIVVNGDVLTNLNYEKLLDSHNKNSNLATICVRDYEIQIPYGVVEGREDNVVELKEKPILKYFINTGVYVLDSKIRKSVAKNTVIDMPSILEKYISRGDPIAMFPVHEYWLDIGRLEDYRRAEREFESIKF